MKMPWTTSDAEAKEMKYLREKHAQMIVDYTTAAHTVTIPPVNSTTGTFSLPYATTATATPIGHGFEYEFLQDLHANMIEYGISEDEVVHIVKKYGEIKQEEQA